MKLKVRANTTGIIPAQSRYRYQRKRFAPVPDEAQRADAGCLLIRLIFFPGNLFSFYDDYNFSLYRFAAEMEDEFLQCSPGILLIDLG